MNELLACPFCGKDKWLQVIQPSPVNSSCWAVVCTNCGVQGGGASNESDAAFCWNVRAPVTASEGHT